jgi:hypothetical protein
MLNKNRSLQSLSTIDDFNSIFAEKNKEMKEGLQKLEFNYKYTFTTSFFKPLMDSCKDEILREILVKINF